MTKTSLKRLLVPALAAVVIGPLIPGILVLLFLFAVLVREAGVAGLADPKSISGFFATAPVYIAASYYFGGPIALMAGLLVGATWIFWHAPTLVIVIAASIAATLVWFVGRWWLGSGLRFDFLALATFSVGAVVAAASCWVLLRGYVSRI